MKFKNTIKTRVRHKYNSNKNLKKNLWYVVKMIIIQLSFNLYAYKSGAML